MENEKVTLREQIGAIMLIVSLGYWFRMGQRWADYALEGCKKLWNGIKELFGTFIHKDDVRIEDPKEDTEF